MSPRPARLIRSLIVLLTLCPLAACDPKKSERAEGNAPSTSEPPKPVGKPVAKQSQILGRWIRDDEGDILAIEFGSDNKAIVHHAEMGVQGAVIFDYALMDGGRVRLTPGGNTNIGFTQIFTCSVKDSQMTFEPESKDVMGAINNSSRFVRLKEGETIQSVMKTRAEAENKRQAAIFEAAMAVLTKPNLALVNTDPKMNLDKFALEMQGSGNSMTGVAYWAGRVVVARQAQLYIQRGGPNQPSTVNLNIGQVIGPPGMQQLPGENFRFEIRGNLPNVDITDGGRSLRSDSETFTSIKERFTKEAEARLAKMNAFADKFGAFTRLDGLLRYPGNPNAQPTRMVLGLLRIEGKPAFRFADMGRDSNPLPAAFNQEIPVELGAEDKPLLSFGNPQFIAETASTDNTTFIGAMSGMQGEFKVGLRLSREELAARRAAIADLLDKQMGAGITLRGLFYESDLPEPDVRITPMRIDLKSSGRVLSGASYLLAFAANCQVTGTALETLLGARLELDASQVLEDKYGALRGRHTNYRFSIEFVDNKPVFKGAMVHASQNNHFELTISTPEITAQDRDRVTKALASGAEFIARRESGTMPARPPSLTFRLDGETLTGTANYQGKRGPFPGVLAGKLVDDRGIMKLEYRQTPGTPAGANACTYHMWAIPEGDSIVLTGYTEWDFENPKRPVGMSFRTQPK